MNKRKDKGKLKEWLRIKGKDILGNVLNGIGESTSIPILSNLIEGIGESLMNDPDLSDEEKQEAAELVKAELTLLKVREQELTKRWESDNNQDLKFPKLIRPSVLAYSWVLITLIVILEACNVLIPSSSIIIGMCGTVNIAYFGSRGYEKVIKFKNSKK